MDACDVNGEVEDPGLMNHDLVSQYLSEKVMGEQRHPFSWKPRLRRFVYHDREIRKPELLGIGEDGIVILVEIEKKSYVLKVVSPVTHV